MDTSRFVGETLLYFVLLADRSISESIQRFEGVISEDSVTFQPALRLRPGRGRGNIGRHKEKRHKETQRSKWVRMDQVWKWKKQKKKNKTEG